MKMVKSASGKNGLCVQRARDTIMMRIFFNRSNRPKIQREHTMRTGDWPTGTLIFFENRSALQMLYAPLCSADPSLGRFDFKWLSDQALMEMLIADMNEAYLSRRLDADKNFKDISQWQGIQCTHGRVTVIECFHENFIGEQFPFALIPPLVNSFVVCACNLSGTLDAAALPPGLGMLNVSRNRLHGEVNWRELPRKLERLLISDNEFQGSCVLTDLPRTLITLLAGQNNLSGDIQLKNLPAAMQFLDLSYNEFHGGITFEDAQQKLVELNLKDNAFTGDLQVVVYLPFLEKLYITGNKLSGSVVIRKACGRVPTWLGNLNFRVVLDEDGNIYK